MGERVDLKSCRQFQLFLLGTAVILQRDLTLLLMALSPVYKLHSIDIVFDSLACYTYSKIDTLIKRREI